MLLEDGETRTRGYKNLEMLLEDGETRTRGYKNLEINNTFLTFLKFLLCIHEGNPRVPPRRGQNPAGEKTNPINTLC